MQRIHQMQAPLSEAAVFVAHPEQPYFHKHQSFIANARFIARLYEMDQRTFIPKVIELAGVQDIAEERLD